ncbi:Set domain-containing protein [Lasiodiplodia theobromae]|uniref:Set domain-containing protein n=1 Tax=Lasiodiplodia theobromae TaxID=45133 RepID=UPI0015C3B71A|nr:Set domain-containing protein [Lasiodiplodia theobromae]KAF4540805.1 Set domain-containing protein [Lasiodiplodia theobromae]
MATSAVIDLVSDDDDDNAVDLGPTRDGAQVRRPALNRTIVPDTLQPRRRSGFSSALAIATIDLTLEDDAAAGVAERPGSAGEGDLAPANEARPDSRSRNQNTSPRTPRTTAEGSSKPRASVSGDTGVAPKLTRVSAKTPPAALNSESPPMFPGRFAHLPGNPSGERHSGASASSTRPPPLNDGSTPAQAHVISDDEDGDNGDDDDLLIDEEKSTPATASRDTLSSGRSTEHVRPTTPPTPPSERETSPIKRLSPIAAEVAERVKQDWGVYPWEIATALNPPQFDATLVCDFCDLARDGCSLERAKQLVEDQVKNRFAKLDGGPGYIITDDIKEARKIFNNLKKFYSTGQRSRPQSHRSSNTISSLLSPQPQPRPHLPSIPSRLNHRRKVHTDPLDSLPRDLRPLFSDNPKPSEEEQRGSSPETVVRPETDGARDRGNETLSNSIQPEELHPEPQDDNPLEALDSAPKDPLPIMSTEAKPTEHADITQPALPVTLLDMGSTESPKSNSCKVPPRDIPTSESFQDLQDTSGWSIESMRDLLNKRVKEIEEDREYFTKFRLGRARRIHHFPEPDTTAESSNDFISGPSIVPAKFAQQEFPWPNATAIQTRGAVKTGESKPRNQKTQEVFSHGSSKGIRSIISNPVDFYAVNTVPVPPYTNYVSLKQNVLAENHRTLMVYPYFDDNQDEDLAKKSLWDELQSRYNIVADELRRRRLLQAEQAWQLRSYAEKIIEELPMEMSDILAYFLLPSDALIHNLQMEMSLKQTHCLENKRPLSCMEEFNRDKKKWRAVLENLPPTTVRGLAIASIFCPTWLEILKFSFWHIARRSSLAQPPPLGNRPQPGDTNGSSDFAYRTLACRVCHLHNCPFHGAILEQPEPSDHSESEDSDTAHDSSDDDERSPSDSKPNSLRRLSISSEASLVNFKKHVKAQPREHPDDDGIIYGLACFKNNKCECWALNRECDPDLCASCGAAEVLDPINRYNDALYRQKCGNVNIQRNVPKRTLLGQSEVQGFGLYAGERLKAGEYIGEYKGEIVTKEEAQEVDSTRAGNKLRFINNSAKAPNCEPRVMLCNTVVRIGLFANKDMAPGEEMFFNYNYPEEVTKHFWEKGQTQSGGTAFAVKTKKGGGGKQKGKAANLSSDSEALASRRPGAPPSVSEALAMQKGLKAKKSAPKVKAEESSRSRIGETPLRGSSTISRYAWATTGKRPRRTALEKQKTWEELEEVLEDFDSFGESDQDSDSANDRPKKKGKKAKV